MALLHHQKRLLYIQVPATGCSVVGRVLRESGAEDIGPKHVDVPKLLKLGLLREDQLRSLVVVANVRNPCDRFVSYYQRLKGGWVDQEYLAVRNRKLERERVIPGADQDRIAEQEQKLAGAQARLQRRKKYMRLATFNNWMVLTLARWRVGGNGPDWARPYFFPMLEGVDLVLRQERLQQAVQLLFQLGGLSAEVNVPVRNTTPGKRVYTEYYNTLSRRLVLRCGGDLMCGFGYGFEDVLDSSCLLPLSEKGRIYSQLKLNNNY